MTTTLLNFLSALGSKMISLKKISALLLMLLLLSSSLSFGQTTVTVGGGATVTGSATPTATYTTPPSGVSFSNWSRGSGVTWASASAALSGSGFSSTSASAAFAANKYYSVTITADATHSFTLNSVVWSTNVSSGVCSFDVQYSNNGGPVTAFGTAGQTSASSNTFSGSVIVTANTSIVLYLIPWGASAGSTVRWSNGSTFSVTASAASPCTGTPAPGNTVASVNPVVSGSSTVLSLQTATTGTGVTYQWQSSTDNSTWTNVASAGTSSTYTATPSSATYYRCNVTCSGSTGTSTPLLVNLTYCASTGTSTTYYISNFTTTGGLTNINLSSTGAAGGYINNSATYSCSQYAGSSINYSIGSIVGSGTGLSIYVDWNNNYSFLDSGEKVSGTSSYTSLNPFTGSFTVPAGTAAGNYRMRIVDDYNSTTPASCNSAAITGETEDYTFTVVAPSLPTITSLGAASGCIGSSITINGTNLTGATAANVKIGGTAVSSITSNTGTVLVAVVGSGTTGTVSVTTAGGTATSTDTFTVNALPTVSVQPASAAQTLCLNGTPTDLSVTAAAGSGTISTYQWYSNSTATTTGGTAVGTSSATYTPDTTITGTKYYYVTITNSNGCSVKSSVSGAVNVLLGVPVISTAPANTTVATSGNTTLTTVATNTPTSYTWEVSANSGSTWTTVSNGGVYTTAATATLTITGAPFTMNGYQYRVTATNACGNSTVSAVATLTVAYCTSYTASGTPSAYITNFTTTGGLTNLNNNSTYISSGTGSFTNLSVSQILGGTINYAATISGVSGGVSFGIFVDWNRNGLFTDSGENVVSLGSSTQITANPSGNFSVPIGALTGNTIMRVVVNYATGSVVSCYSSLNGDAEDYTISLISPPSLVQSAAALTAFTSCSGSVSAEQSYTVSGTNLTANLVVTAPTGFEVSTASGSGFGTSVSLTPSSGTVATTTIYIRVAASATGTPSGNLSITSTNATTLTKAVSDTISSVTIPGTVSGNQTICAGSQPASNLTATPTTGSIVKWQKATDAAFTSPIDIASTSSTLASATIGTLSSTTYFRTVVQSGVCSSAFSTNYVTITVNPTTDAGTVSGNQTICSGSNFTTDLTASPVTGSVIKWQQASDSAFTTPTDIASSNSNTLSGSSVGALSGDAYFRAVVQSGVCSTAYSSNYVIITATACTTPIISATGTLSAFSSCASFVSTEKTFSVAASNLTEDLVISAPTGFEVSTTSGSGFAASVAITNSGTVAATTIYVRVANTASGSLSGSITCISAGAPTISVTVSGSVSTASDAGTVSGNQTICAGSQLSSNLSASPANGTIVKWQKSSDTAFTTPTDIAITSSTLTPANVGSLSATTYFRTVVQNSPCAISYSSNYVTVTAKQLSTAAVISGTTSICNGASASIQVTITNGDGPFTLIYNDGTANTTVNNYASGTAISVTPSVTKSYSIVSVANAFGCLGTGNSGTAAITVNALPTITTATATPSTVCSGAAITLTGANSTSLNYVSSRTAPTNIANTTPSSYGLVFDVTTAFTLNSVDVFNGTTSSGTFIIQLQNSSGTVLQTSSAFTAPVGTGVIGTTSAYTANLGWNIPIGTGYRLLVTSGTASLIRESSLGGFPYSIGSVGSITSGYISGTTTTYYYLYNWKVSVTNDQTSSYSWSWNSTPALATATGTATETNTSASAITKSYTVTATNATTGCTNTATTSAVTVNPVTAAPTASNSAQCGTATPTCSVTGTGTSGNTFKWYTVATGGTAISGQTASTLSNYPISATTTFYVSEYNGTCESARTPVTVTYSAPPTITAAASVNPVCSGSATSLTATSSNSGYTYTWSNSAGTGATVSVSPTTATTYTVTGTDSSGGANNGCTTTASVSVTINAVPSAITLTPSSAPTICNGSVQSIVASGGFVSSSGTVNIGTGTSITGSTSQPTAFCNRFKNFWQQIVFTAAELNAAGLQAGNITAIKFNTAAQGSATSVTDFKIRISTTTNSTLSVFQTTGLTQVYSSANYNIVVGLNTITFDNPYNWDGTSNIIIDIRQVGIDSTNNSTTYYTTSSGNTVLYAVATGTSYTSDGYVATSPTPTASTSRLNTTFVGNIPSQGTISWNNTSSLYTNSAATNAYSGNPTTVYSKPTTTTTYTATATSAAGCTSSTSLTVNVSPTSVAGTASGTTTICSGNSVAVSLSGYTGTIQWQQSLNGTSGWANVTGGSGATAATYTTPNLTATTYYRAIVTSGVCSAATSGTVTITVNPLPTITLGYVDDVLPTDTSFSIPYTATTGSPNQYSLTTAATGGSSIAMPNFTPVSNATLGSTPITVTIPASAAAEYGFNLTVTNATTGCSKDYPFQFHVTSVNHGVIGSDQTICSGATPAPLTSITPGSASDGDTITYTWEKSTTAIDSGYTTIANETGDGYAPGALTQTTYFKRVTHYTDTNPDVTSDSDPVTITVNPKPQGSLSANGPFCVTGSGQITFTATAGTGPFTLVYNDGVADRTVTNVVSGTAFDVFTTPVTSTTTYNLVSITDASSTTCARTSGFTTGSATITVNPVTDGGTASSDQTICSGETPSAITLASNVGSVVKWQSSSDTAFTSPTDITNTSTTLTLGSLSATTYYRAVVQSGACSSANSNVVAITVKSLPTTTIASNNSPVCSGDASFSLTGTTDAVVTYSINGGANTTTTLTGGAATISVSSPFASQVLTLVSVANNGCTNSLNGTSTISISTTTYDGTSWSNGDPDSSKLAVFTGNYTIAADLTACSLRVTNNAVVTVNSTYNVNLNGAITVDAGSSFTMNNNSNLFQADASAVNTGNIIVKRNTSTIVRLDHTLWSSPVTGQNLFSFSPNTLVNRFYVYNTATNSYVTTGLSNTSLFTPAKGFAVRAPNNQSATTPAVWTGTFTGVPNNGTKTFTLATDAANGYHYNLVGNPYPSAISASDFYAANSSKIGGTLYFYAHTLTMNASGLFPTGTNYATWTGLGGAAATAGDGHTSAVAPNGIIQVGQGFIVKATAAGDVTFTNAMRVANQQNQFMKAATTTAETHRMWLNLKTDTGVDINQILVGYMDGATQGVDADLDGLSFGNTGSYLYSKIENNNYVIQARSLPFDTTDEVPLGFNCATAGSYSISLTNTDGLFAASQDVLVRDNLTGTDTSIKTTPYTFTSEAGVFDTRFKLVYQQALGVPSTNFTENSVIVYKNTDWFHVTTKGIEMKDIMVYDISGRLIYSQKDVNATTAVLNGLSTTNQVLMLKITSQEGKTVTIKVIN